MTCALCDGKGFFHIHLAKSQGIERQECPCQSDAHKLKSEEIRIKEELEKDRARMDELMAEVCKLKVSMEQKVHRLEELTTAKATL